MSPRSATPIGTHQSSADQASDTPPESKPASILLGDVVRTIDNALNDPQLLPAARAVVLLRVCQYTQVVNPELRRRYWPKLMDVQEKLPAEERGDFQALREAIEPAVPTKGKLGEILSRIAPATVPTSDRQQAREILAKCEKELGRRRWPFGKKRVWTALVYAWADLDRREALTRLKRLNGAGQKNLIRRLNDRTPLRPDEWTTAHASTGWFGSILPLVKDLLDLERPVLLVPEPTAKDLAKDLAAAASDFSEAGDKTRQVALDRAVKLVSCAAESDPALAHALMRSVFDKLVNTSAIVPRWPERFDGGAMVR